VRDGGSASDATNAAVFLDRNFYGLKDFPWSLVMFRGTNGKSRNLYVVSEVARQMVARNEERTTKVGQRDAAGFRADFGGL
jgi:hypothetical protein